MKRCLVGAIALGLTGPAFASNWVMLSDAASGDVLFYDLESVTRSGSRVQVWVKVDHSRNRATRDRETKSLLSLDCQARTWAELTTIRYDRVGNVTGRQPYSSYPTYEPIIPDTHGSIVWDSVCSPVSNNSNTRSHQAAVRMQPGDWEMSIDAEGLEPRTSRTCVTEEMADRAMADMANGGGQAEANGMICDRSGLRVAGGRMDGTITCSGANMRLTTTINGEITPTSIDMRQRTIMPVDGQTRTINARITGRHIGECSPVK